MDAPSSTSASEPGTTFISYAADDRAIAEELGKALERAGRPVWLDVWDALPGDLWDTVIPKALERAERVLILVTPAWRESWYGPEEVAQAISDTRRRDAVRRVVPVLHGGVTREQLPYGLRRLVPVAVTDDDWDAAVQRLLGIKRGSRPVAPDRDDGAADHPGDAGPPSGSDKPTDAAGDRSPDDQLGQGGGSTALRVTVAGLALAIVAVIVWGVTKSGEGDPVAWPGPEPVKVELKDQALLVDRSEARGVDLGVCRQPEVPESQAEWCAALRGVIDLAKIRTEVIAGQGGAGDRIVAGLAPETAKAICAVRGMRLPTDREFRAFARLGEPEWPKTPTIATVIAADVRGPGLRGLSTGAVEWVRFGNNYIGRGIPMLSGAAVTNIQANPAKLLTGLTLPKKRDRTGNPADFGFRCVADVPER